MSLGKRDLYQGGVYGVCVGGSERRPNVVSAAESSKTLRPV